MKTLKTKPGKVRGIGNLFSEKNDKYIQSECVQNKLDTLHPFEGVNEVEYELNNNKENYRKVSLVADKKQVLLLDYVKLTATVVNDNNEPVEGVPVSFYREDTKCATDATLLTNSDGIAIYNYLVNENQVNTWFFNARAKITVEDKEIQLTSNQIIIEALKRPVNVSYPNTVKQGTSYTGRLIDVTTGNGISNQKVLIRMSRLNGESKTYTLTTDKEGYFSYPQISLSLGTYNFVIVYEGTGVYENIQTDMFQVTVNNDKRKSSLIDVTDTIIRYSNFKGKLIDTDSTQPLIEQIVQVEMVRTSDNASKTYSMTTDSNGYFSQLLELYEGEYIFNLKYAGNDKYEPCEQNNIKIIVTTPTQVETRITGASQVTRLENYQGVLTDKLKKGIPNKNILITMTRLKNGEESSKTYGTGKTTDGILDPFIVTDENGIFSKLITLASNESCNCKYFFTSIFEGDSEYLPCRTGKQEITIFAGDKRDSQIIIPSTVKRFTDYVGTLQDYTTETPLPNKSINLKMERVNDDGTTEYKTYTMQTNEKGEFKQYIELNSGIYTFTSTFAGDNDYNASNIGPQQVEIIEKKTGTSLTLQNTEVISGDNLKFLLTDEAGSILSDKTIIVKLSKYDNTVDKTDSKEYYIKTGVDGLAKLLINLTIGPTLEYYAEAKFLEDKTYNGSKIEKTSFKITPTNTFLHLTSDLAGDMEKNTIIKFVATLKDSLGNPVTGVNVKLMEGDAELIETKTNLTISKTNIFINTPITLSATITDDSSTPLIGIVVKFLNGSNVIGETVTNSSGVASYEFTPDTSGTYTITAYCKGNTNYKESTSSKIVLTVNDYLLYDTAETNKISTTFANPISLRNNGECTIEYDEVNKYYISTRTTEKGQAYIPISSLDGLNNFTVEAEIFVKSSDSNFAGYVAYKDSSNWLAGYFSQNGQFMVDSFSLGTLTQEKLTGYDVAGKWLKYSLTVKDANLTYTLADSEGTVIFTNSKTLNSNQTGTLTYGFTNGWNRDNVLYIKNIKAYNLEE